MYKRELTWSQLARKPGKRNFLKNTDQRKGRQTMTTIEMNLKIDHGMQKE
jgi:hypothetical protein